MPEYPLLVFPEPTLAERAKRGGGGGKFQAPTPGEQAERIAPQMQRLQQAMDSKRLTLQDSALGLQPEQTLVIETIGPVDNFIKAVKKVEGLEWLGEFEVDDIPPAHGFQDERDAEKHLKGQLFLVMTDQRALHELQNLFEAWRRDPEVGFPRGLAPLRSAFAHLHTIRPWDSQDRIRDTGIIEDWEWRVEHGQEVVPFEAELWFRASSHRRQQAESYLREVVESLDGEIVSQCSVPEIFYHGILGRIPIDKVPDIIAQRDLRLLQCEDIMYLRPVGQCAIRTPEDLPEGESVEEEMREIPEGEPIVALFDGLPLAGHRLLDGRLIVDDPDGYESSYQARERHHGTAMASLICHGDLNESGSPIPTPLYVRPILQPRRGFDGQFVEVIPEEVLPVDLVHRSVRRLFEAEGGEPPAAPNVKVINLSVCDPSRPLDRGMSSWARLLDWLSWNYNVLFVVSAGNHSHEIELDVPRAELQTKTAVEREKAVIEATTADTRHRRLFSPAETYNGITVGAVHADAAGLIGDSRLIDPHSRIGLPSTISAHGPGYRRTVKPDMLLPGGRQFYLEKPGNTHANAVLQTSFSNRPPGQCVACPGRSGELNRKAHQRGTSNAAALASHWAVSVLGLIDQLRRQSGATLPPEYDAVLLKALLVHGAEWGDAGTLYESILRNAHNGRTYKDYIGRFLGYGSANLSKAMVCTDQRVTVLGVGKLDDGEGHEFRFPLPPSLSAVAQERRLTITLAWMTPVSSTRQNYRIAHLWFRPPDKLTPDRCDADWQAVQRGTVQHEVLEGARAVDFQDGESLSIKVNCRADASDIPEQIRYGLAVTLEVPEGINLPIYQEVKNRIQIRVPVQGRAST